MKKKRHIWGEKQSAVTKKMEMERGKVKMMTVKFVGVRKKFKGGPYLQKWGGGEGVGKGHIGKTRGHMYRLGFWMVTL